MKLSEPQAIRALAHPLRLDLIELLGALGEATAAECARRLGASQASCSFHLRQLAKYGFVVEADRGGDRRSRPWRLTDLEQRWSSDAGAAADHLEGVLIERESGRMREWMARSPREPATWRRASFLGGMTVPLTSAELNAVGEELRAVVEPYIERLGSPSEWPDGARLVRLFLSSVPLQSDASESTATREAATPNETARKTGRERRTKR